MYLVTIFDKRDAILHQQQFTDVGKAIMWMVARCTINIIDDLGSRLKEPVSWELTRKPGAGTVGQPWLKDATKEYHKQKRGAT